MPADGRHRNVPSRLTKIEARMDELEKELPDWVAELVEDIAQELVRKSLRESLQKICKQLVDD